MTIEAGSMLIVEQLVLYHMEISTTMYIIVDIITMGDITCFDMSEVSTT